MKYELVRWKLSLRGGLEEDPAGNLVEYKDYKKLSDAMDTLKLNMRAEEIGAPPSQFQSSTEEDEDDHLRALGSEDAMRVFAATANRLMREAGITEQRWRRAWLARAMQKLRF